MANDIITTEANLISHHVPGNPRCVLCYFHWANTTHSLLFCQGVKHVWKISKWWSVLKRFRYASMIDIIHAISRLRNGDDLEFFFVKLWGIWKDRCIWTQKPQSPYSQDPPTDMGKWTDNFLLEFRKAQKRFISKAHSQMSNYRAHTSRSNI